MERVFSPKSRKMSSCQFTATNPPNTLPPLLTSFLPTVHLSHDTSEVQTSLIEPELPSASSQDRTPTTPLSLSLSSLSNPFSPESTASLFSSDHEDSEGNSEATLTSIGFGTTNSSLPQVPSTSQLPLHPEGEPVVSPWVDIPSREDLTTRREISPTLRSKIRALKQLAGWTYRHISEATGVALTTVFRTCQPLVPHKGPSTRGRKQILGSKERKLLISVATEYAENRRKPLTEIAYLAGVSASEKTLRSSLACEGYHRRVARVKPYLKPAHLTARRDWALQFASWQIADWKKIIWTDEVAFNVGGSPGRVYVTRTAAEEFDQACLLPKFKKLETVHVWESFCGTQKGPLIFWDKKSMGKTINAQGYCKYIVPHLATFWNEISEETEDYVYIVQDGASAHTANYTKKVYTVKGLLNYVFPWSACSPDLNLIEGVWRLIKSRIHSRTPRPQTNDLMRQAIQEEWDNISIQDLELLLHSMPERVQAVLAANGGHTRF